MEHLTYDELAEYLEQLPKMIELDRDLMTAAVVNALGKVLAKVRRKGG